MRFSPPSAPVRRTPRLLYCTTNHAFSSPSKSDTTKALIPSDAFPTIHSQPQSLSHHIFPLRKTPASPPNVDP
ncbi:hypothetical protein K458DRAFT_420947 [Lentithecium fluviatile CBS 122367]|uniref:Uncharacterized protein n=1 Tax=Lentithecium fluviatile CBS 122367 TaxID=1168545 RepID=A0A6G1IS10_9PLEO|nr:hypothetical protein K458DRAFT_420947 [Lentithecium fluviatile CBS 122367]